MAPAELKRYCLRIRSISRLTSSGNRGGSKGSWYRSIGDLSQRMGLGLQIGAGVRLHATVWLRGEWKTLQQPGSVVQPVRKWSQPVLLSVVRRFERYRSRMKIWFGVWEVTVKTEFVPEGGRGYEVSDAESRSETISQEHRQGWQN